MTCRCHHCDGGSECPESPDYRWAEEELPGRPCSTCKRELPADWKYTLCQECGDKHEETPEDLLRADLEFDARRERG